MHTGTVQIGITPEEARRWAAATTLQSAARQRVSRVELTARREAAASRKKQEHLARLMKGGSAMDLFGGGSSANKAPPKNPFPVHQDQDVDDGPGGAAPDDAAATTARLDPQTQPSDIASAFAFDDDDAMDTEDGTEAEKETGSAWRAAAFKAVLDYDNLPQRLKQAPRPSDRERLDDELRVETEAKLAALAKLEPNMKAIDQYESVKERELAQAEDLELKRSLTKHAQEAFESLKTTRTETFMAAFEHIASAIDRVYKELTQSESHPLGGTAYLSLESPEEPYNHGVKFTAMPPTKRFRDMEQLSGGEKTMAALALLFAIHRCVFCRLVAA